MKKELLLIIGFCCGLLSCGGNSESEKKDISAEVAHTIAGNSGEREASTQPISRPDAQIIDTIISPPPPPPPPTTTTTITPTPLPNPQTIFDWWKGLGAEWQQVLMQQNNKIDLKDRHWKTLFEKGYKVVSPSEIGKEEDAKKLKTSLYQANFLVVRDIKDFSVLSQKTEVWQLLSNVKTLYIENCGIKNDNYFQANLPNIHSIYFKDCNFEGIPQNLITNCDSMYFEGGRFSYTFWDNIRKGKQIKTLNFSKPIENGDIKKLSEMKLNRLCLEQDWANPIDYVDFYEKNPNIQLRNKGKEILNEQQEAWLRLPKIWREALTIQKLPVEREIKSTVSLRFDNVPDINGSDWGKFIKDTKPSIKTLTLENAREIENFVCLPVETLELTNCRWTKKNWEQLQQWASVKTIKIIGLSGKTDYTYFSAPRANLSGKKIYFDKIIGSPDPKDELVKFAKRSMCEIYENGKKLEEIVLSPRATDPKDKSDWGSPRDNLSPRPTGVNSNDPAKKK
ncbi:MAG: hypothetical protein ACKVTZ_22935 [Bacteroidia bacterium]